ncbi:MAG: hypothetical protein RDV41_06190 [Planctomycetota bacterium]|nr:hypothetical protein [Planctomycetota bacterium]
MTGEAEMIFGKLAVQKGFLNETDLADAIRVQQERKTAGVTKTLGEILTELGKLTPDQVKTILDAQKRTQSREEDRTYGELAVLNGFCSVDNIRVALAIQQRAVVKKAPVIPPLGFILRERGMINEQQHQALKQAQVRLGKPLDLLQSTAPTLIAALKAASPAPTCPICGEKAKEGATVCALCESPLSADADKAADVAAAELLQAGTAVESTTFGDIAVKMGFVTAGQLEECLAIQKKLDAKGIPQRLGNILVAKSCLSPAQLNQVVRTQWDKRGIPMPNAAAPTAPTAAAGVAVPQAAPPAAPAAVPQFVPPAVPQFVPPAVPQFVPPAVPKAVPQAVPEAWHEDVPEAWSQNGFPAVPAGARSRSFAPGKIFGYAASAAGLLLLIVVGYFIHKGISSRSSSSDKDASDKTEDFSEQCRKADLALKGAESVEQAQAGTGDFQQITAAYSDIERAYPKTPAANKASARKQKLESAYMMADEAFLRAKIAARDAISSGDHAGAVAVLDEFIARVSTMDGKPMLQEGRAHLQGTLDDAQKDFLGRLDEVVRALSRGKEDAAVERFEKLRDWKLFARCEECGRAFREWDARLAQTRTKLEAQRAAAAAKAQRQEEWRKGAQAAVTEGKRLAGEWKYAEAMFEFRKAMLFSGEKPPWTEAAEGLADTQALLKKTQTDLQSALKFVRNWTLSKMYGKAGAKCREVAENGAFSAFREDILDAQKELEELDRSRGDHEPLVKKLDALQKTINEWVANQLAVDPSLQCPECHGAGAPPCETCGGSGAIKGPNCKRCEGSGKLKCTQCEGVGTAPCPDCTGTGVVERWEEKTVKCEACGGKGKIWGDNKCTECDGKGTVKRKVRKDPVPCKICAGQGRIPCKSCEEGRVECPDCKGRGSDDSPCTGCSGKGSKPCPKCSGSGLAPEKF